MVATVNILSLLENTRQLLSTCKQNLEANDKTALTATLVLVASNKTAIDAAVSAATNVSLNQGTIV